MTSQRRSECLGPNGVPAGLPTGRSAGVVGDSIIRDRCEYPIFMCWPGGFVTGQFDQRIIAFHGIDELA